MAWAGQHPTVEPAFQVPQGSPPSQLPLQSLPPSLTRFLYHREVDNLLLRKHLLQAIWSPTKLPYRGS